MSEKKETRDEIVERVWSQIMDAMRAATDGYPLVIDEITLEHADGKVTKTTTIHLNGKDVVNKNADGETDMFTLVRIRQKINDAVRAGEFVENIQSQRASHKQWLYRLPDATTK